MSILKHQGAGGSDFRFPLRTISRADGQTLDVHAPTLFQAFPNWWWYYEDFVVDALQSDEHFTIYDHSPSGSPTKALVANATGGVLQMKAAATSEAESLVWSMNDNLYVQGNLPFLFAARVKTVHTMAANEVVIVGLGSAIANDPVTPDWITRNVWFRQDASAALLAEADDGTTDTDDKALGPTITAGDWYWYVIERGKNGRLYYGLIDKNGLCKTWTLEDKFGINSPSFGANNLQPLVWALKASGTTQPEVLIDGVIVGGERA